jgi:hypothetical protein
MLRRWGVRVRGRGPLLLAILVTVACSSPTPSPTPYTTGAVLGPVVNIAGNWTGTFESDNFSARTIKMIVVQTGNCVDGVWDSVPAEWDGAISGFAAADSFSGQISFERTTADGKCTAVGNITGPVGDRTLRWTSSTMNAVGQCAGDLPRSLVLTLQRQ